MSEKTEDTSITISVTCEPRGEMFAAISAQFPGLEFLAATEQDAFDSFWMWVHSRPGTSRAELKLRQHPLWSSLREWCQATPITPWMPLDDFLAAVEKRSDDEFQKRMLRSIYTQSEFLKMALVGDEHDHLADAMIYRAAHHHHGGLLATAACWAFRLGMDHFRIFAESMRRDGFIDALEAWSKRPMNSDNYRPVDAEVAREEIPWLVKLSDSRADEAASSFFFDAFKTRIGNTVDFRKALKKADWNIERDANNLKKRRANGSKEAQSAEFRGLIEFFWIPLGLWAKSAEGILQTLQPGRRKDNHKAHLRIQKDIYALGFDASRLAIFKY